MQFQISNPENSKIKKIPPQTPTKIQKQQTPEIQENQINQNKQQKITLNQQKKTPILNISMLQSHNQLQSPREDSQNLLLSQRDNSNIISSSNIQFQFNSNKNSTRFQEQTDQNHNQIQLQNNQNQLLQSRKKDIINSKVKSIKKSQKKQTKNSKKNRSQAYKTNNPNKNNKKNQNSNIFFKLRFHIWVNQLLKIQKSTQTYRYNEILEKNPHHYQNLKDLSQIDYHREILKQNSKFWQKYLTNVKIFYNYISFILQSLNIKIYHPNSKIIIASEFLEFFIIIFTSLILSFFLVFQYDDYVFIAITNITCIFVYLIIILFKINTAYYNNFLKLINNRQKIIRKYKRGDFLSDILGISVLVLNTIFFDKNIYLKFIVIIYVVKIKRLYKLIATIEEKLNFTGNFVYYWELIKLFLNACVFCHLIACLYQLLGLLEQEIYQNQDEIDTIWVQFDTVWYFQYANSFYWALSTMMGGGSQGETVYEITFSCLILLGTVAIFATILGTITVILEDIQRKGKDYNKEKETLNQFFKNQPQGVSLQKELRSRIINYLRYYHQGHQDLKLSENIEEIFRKFPQTLQDQVRSVRYSKLLQRLPLIQKHFSQQIIDQLVNYVEEEFYMPNQVIFSPKDFKQAKLYMVMKGQIELQQSVNTNGIETKQKLQQKGLKKSWKYKPQKIKELQQQEEEYHQKFLNQNMEKYKKINLTSLKVDSKNQLKQIPQRNDYFIPLSSRQRNLRFQKISDQDINANMFGEYQFFTDQIPQYTARSTSFSTILSIKREDFITILQETNQEEFEKFHYFKDQIIHKGVCEQISQKCLICQNNQHSISDCNLLSYQPNKQFLINKYNFETAQNPERMPFQRKNSQINIFRQKRQKNYDLLNFGQNPDFSQNSNQINFIYTQFELYDTQINFLSHYQDEKNINKKNPLSILLQEQCKIIEDHFASYLDSELEESNQSYKSYTLYPQSEENSISQFSDSYLNSFSDLSADSIIAKNLISSKSAELDIEQKLCKIKNLQEQGKKGHNKANYKIASLLKHLISETISSPNKKFSKLNSSNNLNSNQTLENNQQQSNQEDQAQNQTQNILKNKNQTHLYTPNKKLNKVQFNVENENQKQESKYCPNLKNFLTLNKQKNSQQSVSNNSILSGEHIEEIEAQPQKISQTQQVPLMRSVQEKLQNKRKDGKRQSVYKRIPILKDILANAKKQNQRKNKLQSNKKRGLTIKINPQQNNMNNNNINNNNLNKNNMNNNNLFSNNNVNVGNKLNFRQNKEEQRRKTIILGQLAQNSNMQVANKIISNFKDKKPNFDNEINSSQILFLDNLKNQQNQQVNTNNGNLQHMNFSQLSSEQKFMETVKAIIQKQKIDSSEIVDDENWEQNFDHLEKFKFYFPEFNYNNTIDSYNLIQKRKSMKKKFNKTQKAGHKIMYITHLSQNSKKRQTKKPSQIQNQ